MSEDPRERALRREALLKEIRDILLEILETLEKS